ncbi:hypothetical protein EP7_001697 [Isosphaeraceae bacterium EP7]
MSTSDADQETGAGPSSRAVRPLSARPVIGWLMLTVAITVGGWLVNEIRRTIGLDSPRFWELLRDDRVFDLAMLDFFLTAGWAALVLVERAGRRRWLIVATLPLFCVVPSLGIALFLLLDRERIA